MAMTAVAKIGIAMKAEISQGKEIKVAVIDTGINYLHEDLKDRYENENGWDFVNNDNDPMDDNGHGTHCSGIIAATINGIAVVGTAPEASIYAYKVLNRRGSGTTSAIIAGIDRAVADGVQVISMSLGSNYYSQALYDSCLAATENNIVVVAAAGNSGNTATGSTVNYPAKFPFVIAVGATNVNDVLASFSSTGPEVDVVAPGVSILSDYKDVTPRDGQNIDTLYMSGTSMACPHVAGTAALLLKANPSLTPTQIQEILQTTAIDLGAVGPDNYYGWGRIDAAKAVAQCAPSLTVNIVNPTSSYTVEDLVTVQASVTNEENLVSVTYTVGASPIGMVYNSGNSLYEAIWDTSALPDGPYTLEVTATDSSGSKTASINVNVDNNKPAKVEGLTLGDTSATQISILWASNSEADLKGYNIYRSTTSESPDFINIATIEEPTNNYVDEGLTPATTYYYKVAAVDTSENEGDDSSVLTVKTLDASELPIMHVERVTVTLNDRKTGRNHFFWATATVTLVDTSGTPVAGATVYGHWSVATSDSDYAVTNTDGQVVLRSDSVRTATSSAPTFTFNVDDVVLGGWTYSPADSVTSGSS